VVIVVLFVVGEDVMSGHRYIIPGNCSRELEGFLKGLKATHKFRFIKKTKEISRFRGDRIDDGIIRVEFWYEQAAQLTPWVIHSLMPDYSSRRDDVLDSIRNGDTTIYGTGGLSSQTTYTTNFCCHTNTSSIKSSLNVSTPRSDEGITVKGSQADQQFNYGSVGALESKSSVIIIRLKGETERNGRIRPVKKIVANRTRIQCPICGRKWRSHLKFCGNCSTALD
jgi:hypothetical protein